MDGKIRKIEAEKYLEGWNDCLRTMGKQQPEPFEKNKKGRPRKPKRKTDNV